VILFYPNLGVPLHIGHMLTYALGWFTAHAKGEKIAVIPDVNPFAPGTHLTGFTLGDFERLWQWIVSDFDLVGLVPDKVFDVKFVTQHHPDHIVATGTSHMVRGMDLYPAVMAGKLQYGNVETLFGPLITTESYVKLSSTYHTGMWSIPWAVEAVGGGFRLVQMYWQLLQPQCLMPPSLEAMVQEFDPARAATEPIDFHCLPWAFLKRHIEYTVKPVKNTFRQNIQAYLAGEQNT